ncbi:Putative dimethyl sulfoxide reductase chain YnfE precursor [Labrenzia sp. THAF191b]|uniref:molybdopterin-containing oxidoreductase family protein n=1 Tax=unclassified Labrenzia TaxID=2648686 RepID=UPI00126861B7|nr:MULTISPECIES: molybdopterin oxidoreductase family protein [unclassified Labrenzia]QFT00371.1 Putative dimethyl sulfoxide reductase chain YnfE precursor [Labrenzia sp. THAF191b]QFT06684.1 Putative dimethyl sulfoxide reductase chain YnfE precursor [Labrenzia sp. THAF191a]QFT18228.1 Putative dimethyl sulfoxide reductase chain YnfE precursor [Labrenzia sp. THAF187b]
MTQQPPKSTFSACPHDCPSTCALEVHFYPHGDVRRLNGAKDNAYTAGVICAKVARYPERLYHPDRLLKPLRRTGKKGEGRFEEISWDAALDLIAEKFLAAEAEFGAESVWPYHYAGTMGMVQRDSIHRLRHTKGYSRQFDSFCTNMAWTGYVAGTGKLAGPDPREMAVSDQIVIWGTNPVATQVNVMTHAIAARKKRGARIIVVDVYETETMKQADIGIILKPGTDAALACAVMHVLFRDGHADRDYLETYTDCPAELEAHLKTKTPEWAASITGLDVSRIEELAQLIGSVKKTYFRLGYGFTRSRNGAVGMHAASSIAAVTGCWKEEGGGAFHNNGAIYQLNKEMIEAGSLKDPAVRALDQSLVGRILTGDEAALLGGPPVKAMLIQNTNPVSVAPEQDLIKQGFAREDLFTVVHEHFMTETAQMADIVLPATQFLEHDDLYKGGGHQYLMLGPKAVEPPEGPRENIFVINEIARRVDSKSHPGFDMSARDHIDWLLRNSNYGTLTDLQAGKWIDLQPDFETAHYLNGFGHADGKFHFKADWGRSSAPNKPEDGTIFGPWQTMPELPDQWDSIELADEQHPFRLVTSPARSFLNSTFNETDSSKKKEGRPEVWLRPEEAERFGIEDGAKVKMGNRRGVVTLHARYVATVAPGTVISEGIWPNDAFEDGRGINTLTGADPVAPYGGAAFHDTAVWVRAV